MSMVIIVKLVLLVETHRYNLIHSIMKKEIIFDTNFEFNHNLFSTGHPNSI